MIVLDNVRISERVPLMDGGEIIEDAPSAQFFAQPSTERARQFLTKMLSH